MTLLNRSTIVWKAGRRGGEGVLTRFFINRGFECFTILVFASNHSNGYLILALFKACWGLGFSDSQCVTLLNQLITMQRRAGNADCEK